MNNCSNCGNWKNGVCAESYYCINGVDLKGNLVGDPSKWIPCEDTVNHPSHYETGKFECFDVMVEAIGLEETKGFCLCNAFKYIYRCNSKHETPIEDVKKAVWYLNKFIELEGENGEQS